jgi:3-deoxy-manno-octulosonate cytidylyltransferase (CMP-KDO synthetase)
VTARRGAVAIVPVRLGSQRLPGKALLADSGLPLFVHTWRQTLAAGCFERCYVATDSDQVAAAAQAHGAPVIRTSERCRTGSERCAEASRSLDARAIVDVQGDWPEVEPADLDSLANALLTGRTSCATLAVPLLEQEKALDPNVVKVVRALDGHALYFSRLPIPHGKSGGPTPRRLRHVGVYGFARDALLRTTGLASSGLDEAEGLEQLKWLENGMRILVLDGHGEPWGIETRADYEAFLARRGGRQ